MHNRGTDDLKGFSAAYNFNGRKQEIIVILNPDDINGLLTVKSITLNLNYI
jgi:hypothetical protein